jgi:hypothetical protein
MRSDDPDQIRRSNEAADRLADKYRDETPPEAKAIMDAVISAVADSLGESPEAWRGAEVAFVLFGQVITTDPELDDAMMNMVQTLTGAFLDTPAMRALRAAQR